MIIFETYKDYFRFAGAKSFFTSGGDQFVYPKNLAERLGDKLLNPVFKPTDFMMRNIKNPLFIVILTVVAVALVTLAFYPTAVVAAAGAVIPAVFYIQPWMLKLGLYAVVQSTIFCLGMRTIGRMKNPVLVQAWNSRELVPIPMGAIVRR